MKKFLIWMWLILSPSLFFGANLLTNMIRMARVTGQVRFSSMAFGPEGVAHVVFCEAASPASPVGAIFYVKYDGVSVTPPWRVNSDVESLQPAITCNSQGKVLIAWVSPREGRMNIRMWEPAIQDWLPTEVVDEDDAMEPSVAMDSKGNIHAAWWNEGGHCFARSKINGVWEDGHLLSEPEARAMKPSVTMAPDDTAWVVWSMRFCDDRNYCEYKTQYSNRTASRFWTDRRRVNDMGLSHEIPYIGVGPDLIPWVTWGNVDESEATEVAVARIDDQYNPVEFATGAWTQHYPRVAVDQNSRAHLAIQQGGGDSGLGILYMTNADGTWKSQMFEGAWTKRGDVATDLFGNVGVCWSAWFGSEGSDVYICTLDPIASKYFYSPQNLSIAISMSSLRRKPSVNVTLGWTAHPENNPKYIKGYNVYVKENTGNYTLLSSVAASTLSLSLNFTDITKKRNFGITTVNLAGAESEMVFFQ